MKTEQRMDENLSLSKYEKENRKIIIHAFVVSFRWLSLYLPVKSDILKNSQSLKNLIFIRTKTKEKKNEYI